MTYPSRLPLYLRSGSGQQVGTMGEVLAVKAGGRGKEHGEEKQGWEMGAPQSDATLAYVLYTCWEHGAAPGGS